MVCFCCCCGLRLISTLSAERLGRPRLPPGLFLCDLTSGLFTRLLLSTARGNRLLALCPFAWLLDPLTAQQRNDGHNFGFKAWSRTHVPSPSMTHCPTHQMEVRSDLPTFRNSIEETLLSSFQKGVADTPAAVPKALFFLVFAVAVISRYCYYYHLHAHVYQFISPFVVRFPRDCCSHFPSFQINSFFRFISHYPLQLFFAERAPLREGGMSDIRFASARIRNPTPDSHL
jgi:hypothetical protein